MDFGGIDIPEKLVEAWKAEKLVIVAGAGVSVPSGLPNGRNLLSEVSKRCGYSSVTNLAAGQKNGIDASRVEIENEYGTLEEKGCRVRHHICDILKAPRGPNLLHYACLSLNPTVPRVVTTNLDTLFSKAKSDLELPIRETAYTALPDRRDFTGLYYIHGRWDGPVEDYVITMRDFRRAYCQPGSAGAFFGNCWGNYVFLFIGYGAREKVLNQIVRDSIQQGDAFAFIQEGEDRVCPEFCVSDRFTLFRSFPRRGC